MKYNQVLGFYEPSVFHINLSNNCRLGKMEKWSTEEKSVFLHEYIHFLQDITTVQGLHNMFLHSEYVKSVAQIARNNPDHKVKVPVDPFTLPNNVGLNWEFHRAAMGTIDYDVCRVVSYGKSTSYINTSLGIVPFVNVLLQCVDYNGNIIANPITFGTVHLMENMAWLIQESIYPGTGSGAPQCPYRIVEQLADLILPGLSANTMTLVALCEYALESNQPAKTFVEYIENKKKAGANPMTLSAQNVYADMLSMSVVSGGRSVKITSFIDGYTKIAEEAFNAIASYCNVWYWGNVKRLFYNYLQKGILIRTKMPLLFCDLMSAGDITTNCIFQLLLDNLGTPLVTNASYDIDFIPPKSVRITKGEMFNVFAFSQIKNAFLPGVTHYCRLRKYCQKSCTPFNFRWVNKKCVMAPWSKARKFGNCPYAQWWIQWGLKEAKLVP